MKKHLKKRAIGKLLLTFALVLFCVISIIQPTTAFAAGKTDKESKLEPFFHLAYDNSSNVSGIAVLVNAQNKTYAYVWSGDTRAGNSKFVKSSVDGKLYVLSYVDTLTVGSEKTCIYQATGTGSTSGIMNTEPVKKQEKVEVWYLGKDTEIRFLYDQMTISTQYKDNNDGSAFIALERGLTDIWGLPGLVINSNGKCVGVLCGTDVLYCDWFDASVYNGGSGGSGGGSGGSGGGSGGSGGGSGGSGGGSGGSGGGSGGSGGGSGGSGGGSGGSGGQVNHGDQNNHFDTSATELPKHDSGDVLGQVETKRQQIEKQKKIQKGIIIGSAAAVIAIVAVVTTLLIRRKKAIAGVSGPAGY